MTQTGPCVCTVDVPSCRLKNSDKGVRIVAEPLYVAVFECRGTPYEVGRQMAAGYRRTRGKRALTPQGNHRIAALDLEDARRTLLAYAPNLWEELHGLADGLETSLEEAVGRFSNGRLAYPRRGCSAAIGDGLYGRNYDFSSARYDRALVVVQAVGSHAHLGFADRYTGRLDGMNEHGLCIGLHFVSQAAPRPGLVCILIVRIVLDRCASTAEAIGLLREMPHGLAFNYSLLDSTGDAAVVEGAPKGVAIHRGAPIACTNHFRSAALASRKAGAKASSRQRLPPLEAMAAARLDAEALFRALNDADSPAFHHGYARGFGTLHTIVCDPGAGVALIGIGADCPVFRADVRAWAKGERLGTGVLEGRIDTEGDRRFVGRNLAGARFRDVSLAGARFDDINFAGAEITARCNFKEMRIAGGDCRKIGGRNIVRCRAAWCVA